MTSTYISTHTHTTEIHTLSLHDALPICRHADDGRRGVVRPDRGHRRGRSGDVRFQRAERRARLAQRREEVAAQDRKSTRLNSSHMSISYAVFCLKKKKKTIINTDLIPTS